MYKLLSGAKAVKQYRGDENLPEAKKGMKNCGCKHPKSKYKYGTGAIVIPENSAIVTAKHGLGKRAVDAHLRGDDEEVENLIRKMPADKPTGKYKKYKKIDGADALGLLKNVTAPSQATKMGAQYPWFKPFTSSNTEAGRISSTGQSTLLDPNDTFNQYNNIAALEKKAGRKFNDMRDLQGYIYDNMSDEQRTGMWKKFGPTLKSSEMTRENFMDNLGGARTAYGLGVIGKTSSDFKVVTETPETPKKEDEKKKPDFQMKKGFDIPSLAEVGAKASLIKQGIEDVPENYLKLGRYQYASQLPKTLQELSVAERSAREAARDTVGGDAGRYLAQTANLSSARQKAIVDAGTAEGMAKTDLLNKNVDKGDLEAQTNLGLKNQYAQQRAMNRGAYNNMLVSLGQSIDTAADTASTMSNQRKNDAQRLAILKTMADSGNYDIVTNPDGTISYAAKQLPQTTASTTTTSTPAKNARGNKRLKTYKRR